jgi:hypothetical protein
MRAPRRQFEQAYSSVILGAALALSLSGCGTVVSLQPLYSVAEFKHPVLEPRIVGEWTVVDTYAAGASGDFLKWHPHEATIKSPADGGDIYEVQFRPPTKDLESVGRDYNYYVSLVSLGNRLYYDAQFSALLQNRLSLSREDLSNLAAAPAHFLGRLTVEENFLRVEAMNPDWVHQNVPEKTQITSSLDSYCEVTTLLNSTEELRELMLKNADSQALFPAAYFCRAGKDCEALAMEDLLQHWPEQHEILEGAVSFYKYRGNYGRALELQHQSMSDKTETRQDLIGLGEIQLLQRDFAGARSSFLAAEKAKPKDDSDLAWIVENVAWTWFIQGDYLEALTATDQLNPAGKDGIAEPIMLRYYSLLRLGRRDQAATYLRDSAASFKGPLAEHALLLSAEDLRTDNSLSDEPKDERERQALFFTALDRLSKGDKSMGRKWLNAAASKAPGDSLIGMAAQVELERLGAE